MSDHRANLGAMMTNGLRRFASANGDNPINSLVEHPLVKALVRVTVLAGGAVLTIGLWVFMGFANDVKSIGGKIDVLTTTMAGNQVMVREIDRRVGNIEAREFGRIVPRAGGEQTP